jgi:hypothetical protein
VSDEVVILRYAPAQWARELARGAAVILGVVLVGTLLVGFEGIAPFMLGLMTVGLVFGVAHRTLVRRDSPPLLRLDDRELVHFSDTGATLERFTWEEIVSIEHVHPPLENNLLALELTPEARERLHFELFGRGRSRRRDADYTIDIDAADRAVPEVVELVETFAEARRLERFRAAKAELESGEA